MKQGISYSLALFVHVTLVFSESNRTENQSESKNSCILKHLLYRYAGNDHMLLTNMASLYDAIGDEYQKEHEKQHHSHDHNTHSDELKMNKRAIKPDAHACSEDMEKSVHTCHGGSQILALYGLDINQTKELTMETFEKLCPALLFQATLTPCLHQHQDPAEKEPTKIRKISPYALAWIGSVISVIVISISGLGVISLIPLLKFQVYKSALQYLVALAVGTLVGDAILHLLPHALIEHHDHSHADDSSHASHSLKPLVAIVGIWLFFNAERILGIVTSRKNAARKMKKEEVADGEDLSPCRSCDDIDVVVGHSSTAMKTMVNEVHKELHEVTGEPCQMLLIKSEAINQTNLPTASNGKTPLVHNIPDKEKDLNENDSHGHSHDASSFSSVAWMVVMGDGLHNFTDGLAIGAAFVSSISGGMSTSIAVLAHELPHELGDFAMLLKSGMSVKKAYLCNLVSASLQMLGVIIGVLASNHESMAQWFFAFTAGVFLYVGLVNMLPEIAKVDLKMPLRQLLVQNLGLLTGFGIMLVIASYESDIEKLF